MIKRQTLNKLVMFTINSMPSHPTASQIYDTIKNQDDMFLKKQRVKSFKSFVKIINSFEEIKGKGSPLMVYSIKKQFR